MTDHVLHWICPQVSLCFPKLFLKTQILKVFKILILSSLTSSMFSVAVAMSRLFSCSNASLTFLISSIVFYADWGSNQPQETNIILKKFIKILHHVNLSSDSVKLL